MSKSGGTGVFVALPTLLNLLYELGYAEHRGIAVSPLVVVRIFSLTMQRRFNRWRHDLASSPC